MMMTKGNEMPSTGNSLFLMPAWDNGYIGKFDADCSCFCRGCNYTITVSSEHEGTIVLLAKTSEDLEDLSQSEGEAFDSVLYRHTTCYSYKVKDAT